MKAFKELEVWEKGIKINEMEVDLACLCVPEPFWGQDGGLHTPKKYCKS
jgi:hypothetical protein